jgi:putative transposase
MEELLPWMYLKGISTGDFQEMLSSMLGNDAPGLSPSVISRLKSQWVSEYEDWNKRSLTGKRFVYLWCDAVYFGIRGENDKSCVLVIIGATDTGHKELVALSDGLRESKESWLTLLRNLKERGLVCEPTAAVADGALGFWGALLEVFPTTKQQRCWKHKSSNVLDKLPSSLQEKAKKDLQDIWMAETKVQAEAAFDYFIQAYKLKYPKATECLAMDRNTLLTFYSFPAEHWPHLRTSNPVESVFSTVRHRANKTRGCVSRSTLLALVHQLVLSAQKRWQRLRGFNQVAKVIDGVQFIDGLEDTTPKQITA